MKIMKTMMYSALVILLSVLVVSSAKADNQSCERAFHSCLMVESADSCYQTFHSCWQNYLRQFRPSVVTTCTSNYNSCIRRDNSSICRNRVSRCVAATQHLPQNTTELNDELTSCKQQVQACIVNYTPQCDQVPLCETEHAIITAFFLTTQDVDWYTLSAYLSEAASLYEAATRHQPQEERSRARSFRQSKARYTREQARQEAQARREQAAQEREGAREEERERRERARLERSIELVYTEGVGTWSQDDASWGQTLTTRSRTIESGHTFSVRIRGRYYRVRYDQEVNAVYVNNSPVSCEAATDGHNWHWRRGRVGPRGEHRYFMDGFGCQPARRNHTQNRHLLPNGDEEIPENF